MTPRSFSIPEEEDPEPGVPDRIVHGCDYMRLPDGTLEYHYNFLSYTWHIGGEEISGRAYLDEPEKISVFVAGARLQEDPALQALVRYLQRRFLLIESFHADDAGPSPRRSGFERAGGADGTGYNIVFRNQRYKGGT
jgi:hypothetical protein